MHESTLSHMTACLRYGKQQQHAHAYAHRLLREVEAAERGETASGVGATATARAELGRGGGWDPLRRMVQILAPPPRTHTLVIGDQKTYPSYKKHV